MPQAAYPPALQRGAYGDCLIDSMLLPNPLSSASEAQVAQRITGHTIGTLHLVVWADDLSLIIGTK